MGSVALEGEGKVSFPSLLPPASHRDLLCVFLRDLCALTLQILSGTCGYHSQWPLPLHGLVMGGRVVTGDC